MAKKVVALEVTLTAGQAAAELDKLNKAATDTANSVDKVDTEFKTLKQQLKEAQNEAQLMAQKFGDTSKQAIEAQKKVARLKDEVGDFNARVEALNPEAKFRAFAQVAQGVASGFAAAQGAAALFGAESEDVQKALLKLQAAMAIAQGVEGLMGLADSFKTMKVVAIDSLNSIKAAIAANPIFTLVTVIAGVAAAFAAWGQEVDRETEKIKANGEASKKVFDEIEKSLDREIRLRRAAGEETTELERKKLAAVLARAREELKTEQNLLARKKELAKAAADEEVSALDVLSGNIFNKVATTEKAKQVLKEKTNDEILKKEEALAEAQDALKAFDLSQEKKANDEKLKNYNDYLAKKKALEEEEKRRKEEAARRDAEQRERERKADEEDADFIRKQSEEYAKQLAEKERLDEEYRKANLLAEIALVEEKERIRKEEEEMRKQAIEQSIQFTVDTLTTNLNTAATFMEAAMNNQLKKVKGNEAEQEKIRRVFFERQKKLQIAQALISTYQSAVEAYKATVGIPLVGSALAPIAAASAVAAGLANVAQIRSQTFEGGGSGGSASSPAQTIPNLAAPEGGASNTVGSTQLDRESIEQGNQVVIQNNISETEITSTQNRVNRIQARATID